MTITTAIEALTVWAECRLAHGPTRVAPRGTERPGLLFGTPDEWQVSALVEATEGFEAVERALFARFALLEPSSSWRPGWAEAMVAFEAALGARIGKGFHTVRPRGEECTADLPRVEVPRRKGRG